MNGAVGARGTERTTDRPVLAAGCVLWRRPERSGKLEICLVHRPRYDDWSHPKGKLKRGERALDAALREVLEETGHHCVPGAPLPTVRYLANGRPKEVAYWAAEAAGWLLRTRFRGRPGELARPGGGACPPQPGPRPGAARRPARAAAGPLTTPEPGLPGPPTP